MTNDSYWWKLELSFPSCKEQLVFSCIEGIGIKRFYIQSKPQEPRESKLIILFSSLETDSSKRGNFLELLMNLEYDLGFVRDHFAWEKIKDEDWTLSWKEYWEPEPIGRSLLILPAWLELPEVFANRLIIRIDPGIAFGTGNHSTTRLCLKALESSSVKGLRVADLGCGSGILGIAALGLGAAKVFAVDNDYLAIKSSKENAKLNSFVNDKINISLGSIEELDHLLQNKPVDLLVCNIISSTIKELSPRFKDLVCPKSHIILSGILPEESRELILFLQKLGWNIFSMIEENGWVLLDINRN